MDLATTLRHLATDPEAAYDLVEVALAIAADEYVDLNPAVALSKLDDYAEELKPRLRGSLGNRVAELSHFLFEEEGFAGNDDDYYDAKNSYFNDVLDRKLGLPITLSLLATAVGERVGLAVVGVGLPGHFIAKATDGPVEIFFDPYHGGQLLDRDGCAGLIEAVTGQPFEPTDAALAATPVGLVVRRMLTNLKGVYLRTEDFPRAARTIRRLIQLDPNDVSQRRDLGVTLVHSGRPGAAFDHLQYYLDAMPGADDVPAVQQFFKSARSVVARWN